jgi:hypothetical protein
VVTPLRDEDTLDAHVDGMAPMPVRSLFVP